MKQTKSLKKHEELNLHISKKTAWLLVLIPLCILFSLSSAYTFNRVADLYIENNFFLETGAFILFVNTVGFLVIPFILIRTDKGDWC